MSSSTRRAAAGRARPRTCTAGARASTGRLEAGRAAAGGHRRPALPGASGAGAAAAQRARLGGLDALRPFRPDLPARPLLRRRRRALAVAGLERLAGHQRTRDRRRCPPPVSWWQEQPAGWNAPEGGRTGVLPGRFHPHGGFELAPTATASPGLYAAGRQLHQLDLVRTGQEGLVSPGAGLEELRRSELGRHRRREDCLRRRCAPSAKILRWTATSGPRTLPPATPAAGCSRYPAGRSGASGPRRRTARPWSWPPGSLTTRFARSRPERIEGPPDGAWSTPEKLAEETRSSRAWPHRCTRR